MDLLWSSILAGMTSGTPADDHSTAAADDADAAAVGEEADAPMLVAEKS